MILNVEADELVYRYAFAIERQAYIIETKKGTKKDFGSLYTKTLLKKRMKEKFNAEEGVDYVLLGYKIVQPVNWAIRNAKLKLESLRALGEVKLWLSPSDQSNFRNKIAKTPGPNGEGYKAGRGPRPVHYQDLRSFMLNEGAVEISGYEADDALSMYQTEESVAVHIDKDIKQVPGKHLNWVTMERYKVPEGIGDVTQGIKFFFVQMLTGDHTDNIPGIKGLGPVKATAKLEYAPTAHDCLNIVEAEYKKQYKDKYLQVMLEIADLLYMVDKDKRTGSEYLLDLIHSYRSSIVAEKLSNKE